jgi:NADH-quinone oxidoreductase subunit F
VGWISPGAINYISDRLIVPPAEVYGVVTFYALFATTPQPPTVIHLCDDIACKTRGADTLCKLLEEHYGQRGEKVTWKRSPCLGLCEKAPALLVQTAGENRSNFTIAPVSPKTLTDLMEEEPVSPRTIGGSTPQTPDPALTLLKRVERSYPLSLEDYFANEGYTTLRHAITQERETLLQELANSRLTGRGGAAFPTATKWRAVAEATAQPHYVVCNADESEPGTFKDRVLMEQDPFALIEAITIAGYVCRAERGYIYIRGEYPEATANLQNAIERAVQGGYLGENILNSGFTFQIEIRRGAGAYICGEETALLNSLEGKRGEPRNKPPFPVHKGLFGKPTAINNVETLVNILAILSKGGENYATTGTQNSTGTRLFCLSGNIQKPGVYEVPYGTTLRQLLEFAGGLESGRTLQAILLGGAAGVFVRPDEIDMPLTLEGARAANATLGSGVVMVFDDTVPLLPILHRIAAFFRDESCGQCVPCRVGTVRQEEALQRLLSATGEPTEELALLSDLEQVMRDASICGLGHTAASAISSAIHRLGVLQEPQR